MIQDWNLDEKVNAVKRKIEMLESYISKYKVVNVDEGYVDYKIDDGSCPVQLAKKVQQLSNIKFKLIEILNI